MKSSRYCIGIFILSIWLQACGMDVIEMDLPAGEPKLMVEATVTDQAPVQQVSLSWTTSINSNRPDYEENALVILADSRGNIDTLQYTSKGIYQSTLPGQTGLSYHLIIQLEGETYEARATIPQAAEADSISIRYHEKIFIREEGYYVSLYNLDPDETEGYYRWLVWVNDTLQQNSSPNGYFAALNRRNENSPLNLQYPEPFKKGDQLRFHTIKMDKEVYRYYQEMLALKVNDGGLLGPVPVNPSSNISNGAIGVFQAISITETLVKIE